MLLRFVHGVCLNPYNAETPQIVMVFVTICGVSTLNNALF